MELLLLITICLLTGQTLGNDPVKMIFKAGDQDVLLSCSFRGDLRNKTVTWNKDFKDIYVFGNNRVEPSLVDEQFRGRISHFQDGLQFGNASIKITNAKISDAGIYSCLFYDGVFQRGLWKIDLTVGYVRIGKGKDAILPCHYGIDLTAERFEWKKDGKDIFLYDNKRVTYYPDGPPKEQLSHFPDELQFGKASIKIKEANVSDSGNYTCIRINQSGDKVSELHIKLVVGCNLKNTSGKQCDKCEKPTIETAKVEGGVQVDCEALGVSPESKMELKNSANVTVGSTNIPVNGSHYDITLRVILTKEDHYRCVLTHGDICYEVYSKKVHVSSGAGYFLVPSSLLVFSLSLSLGF